MDLMEKVICGEPSFEDTKANYMTFYRPPWVASHHLAELMDRAEYFAYIKHKVEPLRLSFVPRPVDSSGYLGSGLVADLGLNREHRPYSAHMLAYMDEQKLHVCSQMLYEHGRAIDAEGFMSVGYLSILLDVFKLHVGETSGGGLALNWGRVLEYASKAVHVRHLQEVNTGDYRDIVERHLDNKARTVGTLMEQSKMVLDDHSPVPGRFHGLLSMDEAKLMIRVTCGVSGSAHFGLHAVIIGAGGQGASAPGWPHHFLAMWHVDDPTKADMMD